MLMLSMGAMVYSLPYHIQVVYKYETWHRDPFYKLLYKIQCSYLEAGR
jgi:hypothetical protein